MRTSMCAEERKNFGVDITAAKRRKERRMERDSLIYKVRRRFQVLAQKVLPDEFLSKVYFKLVLHKELNLRDPATFNEKLQWMKLYYFPFNQTVIRCADKFEVRAYIEERGYGSTLVPLLGVWEKPEDIPWRELPEQFVLKCNHGCAYNILCPDKSTFDRKKAQKQFRIWLKEDFGAFNIERHYSHIKPRMIICEEYLGDCITDYKFFCFNGKPKYIYVSNDLIHDRQAQIGFFYLDGKKMPLKRDDYADIASVEFPPYFGKMREMAEALAQEFPFVRVDFFVANDRYYFAELTFTPGACMMPFNPERYDLEWGKQIDLSEELRKKNCLL